MTDTSKVPERKLRHGDVSGPFSSPLATGPEAMAAGPCVGAAGRSRRPQDPAWRTADVPPVQWWRTQPCEAFGDADRILVSATLARIGVLRGGDDLPLAIAGDAEAAIAAALDQMPVDEITLPVDITMTALVRAALDGNPAAALVMAQVIGLTDLGHEHEVELAGSWLAHGRRRSAEPDKFDDAEVVLMAAFEELRIMGHGA